jgi:hypothetical protein
VIGAVFTLRGAVVVPPALATALGSNASIVLGDGAWSTSIVALSLGMLYLAGTVIGWKRLGTPATWNAEGNSPRPRPTARATAH